MDNVIGCKLYIALLVAFSVYEDGSVDEIYIVILRLHSSLILMPDENSSSITAASRRAFRRW